MDDQDFMAALSKAFQETEGGEASEAAETTVESGAGEAGSSAEAPVETADDPTEPLLPQRAPESDGEPLAEASDEEE